MRLATAIIAAIVILSPYGMTLAQTTTTLPPKVQKTIKEERTFWLKEVMSLEKKKKDKGQIWKHMTAPQKKSLASKIQRVARLTAFSIHAPSDKKKREFTQKLRRYFYGTFCGTLRTYAKKAYYKWQKRWISKRSFRCAWGGRGLSFRHGINLKKPKPKIKKRCRKKLTWKIIAPIRKVVQTGKVKLIVLISNPGCAKKFLVASHQDSQLHPQELPPNNKFRNHRIHITTSRTVPLTYDIKKPGKVRILLAVRGHKTNKRWTIQYVDLTVKERAQCKSDFDCPIGHKCENGKCVKTCPPGTKRIGKYCQVIVATPTPRTRPPEPPPAKITITKTDITWGERLSVSMEFLMTDSDLAPAASYARDKGYYYSGGHLGIAGRFRHLYKKTWLSLYFGVFFISNSIRQPGQLPLDVSSKPRLEIGGEILHRWKYFHLMGGVRGRLWAGQNPDVKSDEPGNETGVDIHGELRAGIREIGLLIRPNAFLGESYQIIALGGASGELFKGFLRYEAGAILAYGQRSREKLDWNGSRASFSALLAIRLWEHLYIGGNFYYHKGWDDSLDNSFQGCFFLGWYPQKPKIRLWPIHLYYKRAPKTETISGSGDKPPTP